MGKELLSLLQLLGLFFVAGFGLTTGFYSAISFNQTVQHVMEALIQ